MENNKPFFSVIVPIYNAEKYLSRCIDSVLDQTFEDFELLLINDGSHDSSAHICDEYRCRDTRVHLFHKTNGGVSSARNLGLDNAIGQYIVFIDSDDYISNGLLKEISLAHTKDADLIAFNGIGVNKFNKQQKLRPKIKAGLYDEYSAFKKVNTSRYEIWLHAFSLELLNKFHIRFSENIKYAEDLEFTFKTYFISNGICIIDYDGYVNCYNSSSAMQKRFTLENVINHYLVINSLNDFYHQHDDLIKRKDLSDAVFLLVIFSVNFIVYQRISLWFQLDLYYKKFFFKQLKKIQFTTKQSCILLSLLISVFPLLIFFTYRNSRQNRIN